MDRWEYDYVTIEWDEKKQRFLHNLRNLEPQTELYAILDHLGADGWEMVNMWPQGFAAANMGVYWGVQHTVTNWAVAPKYAAVFKRKVAA